MIEYDMQSARQFLARQDWRKLLTRQREEHDILARNHTEEREAYYRRNKAILDSIKPEDL